MAEPKLDWSTAEVSDARLRVSLDGETPREWQATFERTAALLGCGDWDEVKLKKQSVQVSGVTAGSEDKLRHYLESIVQEANAAHAPDDDEGSQSQSDTERGDADAAADSTDESAPSPDSEMTERFRSFSTSPRST